MHKPTDYSTINRVPTDIKPNNACHQAVGWDVAGRIVNAVPTPEYVAKSREAAPQFDAKGGIEKAKRRPHNHSGWPEYRKPGEEVYILQGIAEIDVDLIGRIRRVPCLRCG